VVFIGSGHIPNVEAAAFLVESVAPALPHLVFGIIGSVCDAIGLLPRPSNVVLFGILDDAEKNALLKRAVIAANPLFEGGGSSLKVPDFFAARLALVSTSVGVRGYELQPNVHYILAERADFVAALRMLSSDEALRERIADAAREYGRTALDWRVLGARYRRTLHKLLQGDFRPRLLVVTYRFADPPPGGAEAFMVNVLRELDAGGKFRVDVATCDVGTIDNKWHFSANYQKPDRADGLPPYINALFRFPVDEAHGDDFESCARLFRVWMAETRRQAIMLPLEYERPVLLGGWNFAESTGKKTIRWTSTESQVYVGKDSVALKVIGHAPRGSRIELTQAGRVFASRVVEGDFEWTANLPGLETIVTLCASPAFAAGDDPRELGVMVREIATMEGTVFHSLDLKEDFESVWRRRSPQRWVSSLRELAEMRNRADDDLFVAVRGPRSSKLRTWLADHIAIYDVVLAHGVPFSTPIDVAQETQRQIIPLVLLPHFHMEDRYYHWRRYYDTFREAACVIAAPAQVKSMFFDQLGAVSALVPGGGVDLNEFEPARLDAAKHHFRKLHGGQKPFVLVLGRKTGAKQYHIVIDAVQALNRDTHRVDLVLIGPDEDGIKVTAAHTYCYGAQPRDVVLGALSDSLCLVNMSESESFGIVLLEAWLAGKPVIAQRRCVAFADLVVPDENGFLAESTEDVVEYIDRYMNDAALALRHAESGRISAKQFSWADIAQQIGSILFAAAGSAPASQGAGRYDVVI
jgi:glycosyltransferase involved in cell wall biosynthesis